ncbi:hypothetical protein [Roseisolibacter sp. H3M3-2]|uniref:hypothetical protein n=1 Tax=Roseisolibacter sp. H3M3-2 TaxID=3031323 RepID=UPI0023DC4F55|nr:hypothetical protein [Roseisolibacter sp. H3M3-2]MDF1505905.1 hypothetical protein [Roseisolibacter sp. H3M3-2]
MRLPLSFAALLLPALAGAQQPPHPHAPGHAHPPSHADTSFAAVQARGKQAMGVDQYTSAHRFDDLADGGRITLVRDAADTAGARVIRAHLRDVAAAFARGDFATPGFVHGRDVPGTAVLAARRAALAYAVSDLPGGGALRITTADPAAVKAVHEFLAFQRRDHRAPGEVRGHP